MLKHFVAVLVILAVASPAFAATVSMNFKFNVEGLGTDLIHVNETTYLGQNLNSTFRPQKPYISAETQNMLAALVFAGGGFPNIRLDTGTDPYNFRMTQEGRNNRFLIAVTEAGWQDIDQ